MKKRTFAKNEKIFPEKRSAWESAKIRLQEFRSIDMRLGI